MTPKIINTGIDDTVYNELSIQVSLDGLSFCVLNTTTNTVSHYNFFPFNDVMTPYQLLDKVKRVFNSALILQSDFKKVKVIYMNELSTFVPKPLFSDKNLADYLKFNTKVLQNDYITYDVIANNDMVNVYVPYVNINNFVFAQYGSFEYKHFATVLVENILAKAPNKEEPIMYVNMQLSHFEIVVVKNRKLLFYNSFRHSNKEDYIYYLLFTAEQLNLNPDKFDLYFLGDVLEGDRIHEITYKYVRNVFFGERTNAMAFEGSLQPNNEHSDYILLNSL